MSLYLDRNAGGGLAAFERSYLAQRRKKRLHTALFASLLAASFVGSVIVGEIDLARLARGLPMTWNYIAGTVPDLNPETLRADIADWYWGFSLWLRLIAETVLMGFVGTAIGAGLALLICFPASRNLIGGQVVFFLCRRLLEVARTVPELVYALIFVYAFGLGALAGVLAIAIHTLGALGKLFSEVNENVDQRPIEGLRAAGANWPMTMRLAVLPQVLPNFASYALLRFEINVRSASILGFVGAGGIGQELYLAVRQFEYPDISAILLMIIVMVSVIDILSEAVRHRLIGSQSLRLA